MLPFLASQDALEVMFVRDWLSDWVGVCIDLTDVTLVSEDTYGDDDEDEDLIHLFQLIHLLYLFHLCSGVRVTTKS